MSVARAAPAPICLSQLATEDWHAWQRIDAPITRRTELPDRRRFVADEAEAVARVRGTSVNALIIDSLAAEIERVRKDKTFTVRARQLLERDKELLDRLAQ